MLVLGKRLSFAVFELDFLSDALLELASALASLASVVVFLSASPLGVSVDVSVATVVSSPLLVGASVVVSVPDVSVDAVEPPANSIDNSVLDV